MQEPWITCVRADGQRTVLGLRALIEESPRLLAIEGDNPFETASLHLLCSALLIRAYNGLLRSGEAWDELWARRAFDLGVVDHYLARWGDRFDLFDPIHPFFQDPTLPAELPNTPAARRTRKRAKASPPPPDFGDERLGGNDDAEEAAPGLKPATVLGAGMAAGYRQTLFDHHVDEALTAFSPVQVARMLVSCQAFAPGTGGGRQGRPEGVFRNGILFLPCGRTLFETLALGIHPLMHGTGEGAFREGVDLPFWEEGSPSWGLVDHTPGWTESRTRPCRRVLLVRDGDGLVRRCWFHLGRKLNDAGAESAAQRLRCPYHFTQAQSGDKGKARRLPLVEGKAVWRDLDTLLAFCDPPSSSSPWVPAQALAVLAETLQLHSTQARLLAFGGVWPRSAQVTLWREEHLVLPMEALAQGRKGDQIRAAIKKAVRLASVGDKDISTALSVVASRILGKLATGQGASHRVEALFGPWDDRYWSGLQTPFWRFVQAVARDGAAAGATWEAEVDATIWEAWVSATNRLSPTFATLEGIAQGEVQLSKRHPRRSS